MLHDPGTLTAQGALYQQAYAYDVDNRLTQGPLGTGYTYGDTTHIDAVTSAPNYTASYGAAGDMTSRNGQVLGYDLLHRLISWQNTANNPTQTASYAYDGEGSRVQQTSTASGSTTTTSYIGSFEEVSTTGSSTTTTKYYSAGVAKVTNVNGTLSYLVADDLGSVSEALTSAGGVQATQLYSPYGTVRYTNGTMPTSYGYTGQRADPSGLMYYNARYYDPSAGQFVTADTVQGLNRYAYVAGNPETLTDPTGNGGFGSALGSILAALVGMIVVAKAFRALTSAFHLSAPSRGSTSGSGHGGSGCKQNCGGSGSNTLSYGSGSSSDPPKVTGTDPMHEAVVEEFYIYLENLLEAMGVSDEDIGKRLCMETFCRMYFQAGAGVPRTWIEPDIILWDTTAQTTGQIWEIKPSRGGNDPDNLRNDVDQLYAFIGYALTYFGKLLKPGGFYIPEDGLDSWGGHAVSPPSGNVPSGSQLRATMNYSGLIQYYLDPPPASQPQQPCAAVSIIHICGNGQPFPGVWIPEF